MKVGVIAANGRAGRRIVKLCVEEGFDVTAIVRHENQTAAQNVLLKDLFDLTTDDVKDFDVIVDAFGTWDADAVGLHVSSMQHLISILQKTDIRLIVVGGAGSLIADPEMNMQLVDTKNFPEKARPVAKAMSVAFDNLRISKDLRWTYVSPAVNFKPTDESQGHYVIVTGDNLSFDKNGKSEISYADYARALVDEIKNDKHENQRISVRW